MVRSRLAPCEIIIHSPRAPTTSGEERPLTTEEKVRYEANRAHRVDKAVEGQQRESEPDEINVALLVVANRKE